MLAVTSIGMVSPVGHDSATSCASIRAGLTRQQPLPGIAALGEDSGEEEPVFGCVVPVIADGFVLVGRWIRLLRHCLDECTAALPGGHEADAASWQRTGLAIVLPELSHERFDSDEECAEPEVARAVLPALLAALPGPVSESSSRIICRGHAGTALACEQAAQWLAAQSVDRVIIAAVDSYVDAHSIHWLDSIDRLRTGANPAGMLPGEGAAAFVLEPVARAARRGSPRALLEGVGTAFEAKNAAEGELGFGVGLSHAVGAALRDCREPVAQLISDMNGETWRAHEFGCMRMRLQERLDDDAEAIVPAASVGDVGAASGALAVNMCVHAFERGYARSTSFLIVSSSDGGDVGAMRIVTP